MVVIHVPSGVRIAMTARGALTSLNAAAAARFSASVVAGARPSSTRVSPPPWTEAPDVVAAASPDELSSLPHAAAVAASIAARTIAATLLVRTGSATLVPRSPPKSWASALRASELVALDVEDLSVVGDPATGDGGLLIRVRAAKGADHPEWVAVPFASSWTTCAVRRTIHFVRGVRGGPLFRHIDRHGRTRNRIAPRVVTDVVRRSIVDALRLDPAGYTSHSLRAGFVTEARAQRVPDELIARHTRHARPGQRRGGLLNVYDRPNDLFERPALDASWW